MNYWKSMPDPYKGVVLMAVGSLLLLYASGLLTQGLNTIFMLTSLSMIAYGAMLCNLHTKLLKLLKKGS